MQIKVSLPRSSPYLGWRVASIVVMGAMFASIIMAAYFMYQNIYRVLDDANTIIVLNSSAGSDNIDLETFTKVQGILQTKKNLPQIPTALRDVFVFAPTTSPHVSPAPTTTSTPATSTPGR